MKGRLIGWGLATVLSGLIGYTYANVVGGTPVVGATVGCIIGGSLVALEVFVVQQPVGEALRRLPLPVFIGILALIWLAIITVSLQAVPRLILGAARAEEYEGSTFQQDFGFAFLVSVIFNVGMRVRMLIGPRVLTNFLIGRYHRPLREQRMFMFLDLADSTRLAETLGDIEVQNLIRRFFFDIAAPIARHGGETHRYIGDEIVVTWPLDSCLAQASCLQCVLAIYRLTARNAPRYRDTFGVVPRFRIGLHGGSVVASEVGDEKREIVYFGDTVNTAARLCAACKEHSSDVLISSSLLGRMTVPHGIQAKSVGGIGLTGKEAPFFVTALRVSTEPQMISASR